MAVCFFSDGVLVPLSEPLRLNVAEAPTVVPLASSVSELSMQRNPLLQLNYLLNNIVVYGDLYGKTGNNPNNPNK